MFLQLENDDEENESGEKEIKSPVLKQPHDIQILAVLRLLGLSNKEIKDNLEYYYLENHLI